MTTARPERDFAGQRLLAGVALQVPIGRSRIVDPHDGGLYDPMLQPGSGSWDVVGAGTFGTRRLGLDWSASGSYQVTTVNGRSTASATRPSAAWA